MCVHRCGWTSKYAYAYLKLLERKDLWPARLLHISISKAIELAEKMPDPIPEEPSIICRYEYKHAAPEYRGDRCRSLDILNNSIGLCTAFDRVAQILIVTTVPIAHKINYPFQILFRL
jgi:hypothetical protein